MLALPILVLSVFCQLSGTQEGPRALPLLRLLRLLALAAAPLFRLLRATTSPI